MSMYGKYCGTAALGGVFDKAADGIRRLPSGSTEQYQPPMTSAALPTQPGAAGLQTDAIDHDANTLTATLDVRETNLSAGSFANLPAVSVPVWL